MYFDHFLDRLALGQVDSQGGDGLENRHVRKLSAIVAGRAHREAKFGAFFFPQIDAPSIGQPGNTHAR